MFDAKFWCFTSPPMRHRSFFQNQPFTPLFNNIAGKITECWLVNEESIFT